MIFHPDDMKLEILFQCKLSNNYNWLSHEADLIWNKAMLFKAKLPVEAAESLLNDLSHLNGAPLQNDPEAKFITNPLERSN